MFSTRSNKKELLDEDNITKEALFQNLKELDVINNLLGGYNITFNALKKIVNKNTKYTLVDIGSGGGDTLKRIGKWCLRNQIEIDLKGVDLKPICIEYSIENNPTNIQFICDDYRNILNHIDKVDILHASLFCHHLKDEEITTLIKFCVTNKIILIINDLERNAIAYYAIKFLTAIFSKSYLVKNDAPLSVLRGFKTKEWKAIIKNSGAKNYTINYKWAFRHEVIIYAK